MADKEIDSKKNYMSPEGVEALKREIEILKAQVGAEGLGREGGDYRPAMIEDHLVDKSKLRSEITKLERQFEEYSPKRVSDPILRDRIVKEREELERQFKPYLETRAELRTCDKTSREYIDAMDKAMDRLQNKPEIERAISKWKHLGRILEPDDPRLTDLNRLRK